MPSSSSSEEDLSKFREATDSTLYNESLFKGKQAQPDEKPVIIAPPSLRYIEEEEDRIHNELKVTPSFQKQLELKDKSAENSNPPIESRNVLKAKRGKNSSSTDVSSSGGVRLLGASAVFLSNLNIVPSTNRRRKRGRNIACFSSGSESSSEEIDSDDAAADISQNRVLSGNASKGFKISKPLLTDPSKDDLSRGYESLNEIGSNSNPLSIEALSLGAKDDMAFLSLHKKKNAAHFESELAASVSSMLSLGSDSQGDLPKIKKKKMKKKKKRRKEQYSEDATTETTEVEDIVEERRKKVKKAKRRRRDEKKAEEMAVIRECVPGLLEETEENVKCKECKKKKKRMKVKGEESYFKKQKSRFKLSKSSKTISKKKMSKNVSLLSEDLAKLMMNPNEAS
ncbi:defective in germ line development protein 3-like isoform X2 [Thrips palmi]|uniref:Defective in germ line development protein 3-like isoform X2 n=1 Tax=Thrips palmi TaxID=161013 RepID=A0A6P8YAU9_THRPL|nr:defective in germ line development protein 3-like isoform X2 [Thrips palmi]